MNYAAHNKELQNSLLNIGGVSARRSDNQSQGCQPVVFTKADSALLTGGKPFFVPSFTQRCDYETELCVRINHLGRSIPERFAHRYYDAFTVGIDFTARDMQKALREEGQPWEIAKGFDGAAVIGEWIPKESVLNEQQMKGKERPAVDFSMLMNGELKQKGNTVEMLCSIDRLISYISQYFTLKTGDMIYTGTPVGVGAVKPDDHIEGFLNEKKILDFWCR